MEQYIVQSRKRPGITYAVTKQDTPQLQELWDCTCDYASLHPDDTDCSHIKAMKVKHGGGDSALKPNELLLSVAGKAPVSRKLMLDQEVILEIKGQVVKTEMLNRQDGTYDDVVVVKAYSIDVKQIL